MAELKSHEEILMALLRSRHGNSTKSRAALPCEIGLISLVSNLVGLPIGIGSGVRFAPRADIGIAAGTGLSSV